jgi:hypothetical protein
MSFGVFVHKFNTKGLLYDDVVSSDDNRLTSRTYVKNTMTGIVDDSLVQVDGSGVAANDFAKFTANGVEGRSYAEVLADLSGQAAAAFSLNSQKITNLAVPTAAADAATKGYVDAAIEGLDVKESVRLASTANVAGSYSSGVLTLSSGGVLAIDGGNVALSDRVLLKDQGGGASHVQNGIYTCTTAGEAASGTDPNTGSAYTGGDAQFGSSSSISNITMTAATLSSSSSSVSYASYTGSAYTPPANGVVIFTTGSATLAFNLAASTDSLNTLTGASAGGTFGPIGAINEAYSSVSVISVTASTTVTVRSRTVAPLVSLMASDELDENTTSISISAGWGGSTIPTGKYLEFKNWGGNAWYWRVQSDIANGDTSISVAFDSDSSYSSTPSFYPSASSTFAMFDGQSGGSAVAAVLTRAGDFDADADITAGAFCFVEEGTASADSGFVLSTNEPITLDSTALGFTQFSSAGVVTAGAGITKTGVAISIASGAVTNAMLAGSIVNAKLSNSSVSFGGVSLDLGGTNATPAFDLTNATNYPTTSLTGTITSAQLAGSVANAKLANSAITIAGASTALGGSITADVIAGQISAATITNAQLAGSIVNAKLSNSSVSFGGVSVSLGAADLTPAFDLAHATGLPISSGVAGLGTDVASALAGTLDTDLSAVSGSDNSIASAKAIKAYVDSVAQGLSVKDSVRVATTAAITIATALNSGDSIDGVTLANGDRVLVKDQTPASQNGIYVVAASPARSDDFDATADVSEGAFFFVEEGSTNADNGFVMTSEDVTVDSDSIAFVQFSGAGQITAGAGLTKVANALSISSGAVTNAMLAGSISNDKLAGSIANAKLSNSSVSFGGVSVSLGGTNATPAFDLTNATSYPTSSLDGTITSAQLAGSVANAKLANSAITIAGASTALGGSITADVIAGQISAATITNAQLAGSVANAKLANSAITIAGASTALGGSITADAIAGQISAATITNAQLAGSIANDKLAGSIAASKLADAPLQDVAGLAVTDGNFIVGNGSNFVAESGATARASLALGSAAGEALTATVETTPSTLPTTVATLKGVYAYNLTSLSAEQALTLPASYAAGDVGAMVRFKLNSEAIGSGATVKIQAGTVNGQKMMIDGDPHIVLDQPYQSVTLCLTKVMSSSSPSTDELCWSIL